MSKMVGLENSSICMAVLAAFDKNITMSGSFGCFQHINNTQKQGVCNFDVQNLMFFAGKLKKQGIFWWVDLNFLEFPKNRTQGIFQNNADRNQQKNKPHRLTIQRKIKTLEEEKWFQWDSLLPLQTLLMLKTQICHTKETNKTVLQWKSSFLSKLQIQ